MGKNHIGDIEAGILTTAMPARSADVDFFPGQSLKWGLGYMINVQPGPNSRSAGSLTWAGIFNTYYWIDPTRRVGGVIMTQVLPFATSRAAQPSSRSSEWPFHGRIAKPRWQRCRCPPRSGSGRGRARRMVAEKSGNEPLRLAHLDHCDDRAILLEGGEGPARVKMMMLRHGRAPSVAVEQRRWCHALAALPIASAQ
jgi:hypothetical protein